MGGRQGKGGEGQPSNSGPDEHGNVHHSGAVLRVAGSVGQQMIGEGGDKA